MDRDLFASDNVAGLCPAAWQALADANAGAVLSYGEDRHTAEACDLIRKAFDCDAEVFFVFNGSAANSLALSTICQGHDAVICHEMAHIMLDECGSPEFFTGGAKLLGLPGNDAKLTPDSVMQRIRKRTDLHHVRPRALSLTQATEFGTVYTLEEFTALTNCAHDEGLRVHVDGARLAHAIAHLGVSPAAATWQAGVDVLSLGLAKLGAGLGEAVVFFDHDLARDFDRRCKHAAQLASKMRLITAPWCGMLRDGHWLSLAAEVNALAQSLRQGLETLDVEVLFPTEANAVFMRVDPAVTKAMHARHWHYYELAGIGDSRLMCSWATQPEHVKAFLTDLKDCLDASN